MLEVDNTLDDPRQRATLITGETGQSLRAVTAAVSGVAEAPRPPKTVLGLVGVFFF